MTSFLYFIKWSALALPFCPKPEKGKNYPCLGLWVEDLNSQNMCVNPFWWPAESVSRPDLWAGRVLGQIESQMQRMVLKGRQKVILQLEPESLGKLKMEVSLSEHGVTAKMTTDSAAAREIIFTHVHALKEVDAAAMAVAREPAQVVEILKYVMSAK